MHRRRIESSFVRDFSLRVGQILFCWPDSLERHIFVLIVAFFAVAVHFERSISCIRVLVVVVLIAAAWYRFIAHFSRFWGRRLLMLVPYLNLSSTSPQLLARLPVHCLFSKSLFSHSLDFLRSLQAASTRVECCNLNTTLLSSPASCIALARTGQQWTECRLWWGGSN